MDEEKQTEQKTGDEAAGAENKPAPKTEQQILDEAVAALTGGTTLDTSEDPKKEEDKKDAKPDEKAKTEEPKEGEGDKKPEEKTEKTSIQIAKQAAEYEKRMLAVKRREKELATKQTQVEAHQAAMAGAKDDPMGALEALAKARGENAYKSLDTLNRQLLTGKTPQSKEEQLIAEVASLREEITTNRKADLEVAAKRERDDLHSGITNMITGEERFEAIRPLRESAANVVASRVLDYFEEHGAVPQGYAVKVLEEHQAAVFTQLKELIQLPAVRKELGLEPTAQPSKNADQQPGSETLTNQDTVGSAKNGKRMEDLTEDELLELAVEATVEHEKLAAG